MIRIRPATAGDTDALAQIFFDAVHIGAAPKYSAAERAAWAPARPDATTWATRLQGLATWVADAGDTPVGFMSLRGDGYLDLAYIAPDWRGKGVADALLATLITHARDAGLTTLTTEASEMARPFFLRHGWQLYRAQYVERRGQQIRNYQMGVTLSPQP